jgi:hypothetical protein
MDLSNFGQHYAQEDRSVDEVDPSCRPRWVRLKQANRQNFNRDATTAKALEDYYPQTLRSMFVADAPGWFHATFRVFRSFLPNGLWRSSMVINSGKNEKEAKLLLKHLAEEGVPVKYGSKLDQWPPTR